MSAFWRVQTQSLVANKKEYFKKAEAIEKIRVFLNDLFVFTDNELLFVEKFKSKEYCPELLFQDSEIVDRIKNHPMAKWRCSQK